MRYITDIDNYVKEVSFGADIECNGQTCTEYTGAAPEDYLTLEDWYLSVADNGTINAYYIDANGNLVLDPEKEADIRAATRQEALLCGLIMPPNEDKFTEADADKIRQFIMGQTTLTDAEKKKYDVNGDGSVTATDRVIVTKLIGANISKNAPGKIIIDPTDWGTPLKLLDGDGNVVTSLGFEGVKPEPYADYVVDQGVDNGWTWRKWNSGVAECWANIKGTGNTVGGNTMTIELPFYFSDTNFVVEATRGHNGSIVSIMGDYDSGGNRTHGYGYFYFRYILTSGYYPDFNFHVTGRWK